MAKQARDNWEITTLLDIVEGKEPLRWYAEKLTTAGYLTRETYRRPGQRGRDSVRYVMTEEGRKYVEENKNFLDTASINTREVREEVQAMVSDEEYTQKFVEFMANPTWSADEKLEIIYSKRTRPELVPEFVALKYAGNRIAQTKCCRAMIQVIEGKKYRPDLKW